MTGLLTRPLAALLAVAAGLGAGGCQQTDPEPDKTTLFAMDTVMNLTVYDREGQALAGAAEEIYHLEGLLSATDPDSEVSAINRSAGAPCALSPETGALLEGALALCRETGGALDITAYPAVEAWGFPTGAYQVPDREELDQLAGRIDYTQVALEGETVTLPDGMALDLGGVAKGYAGDVLAGQLREAGCTSALLDLGQSTIQTVGTKPDGSLWRIGIQDPAGEGYLGVLELGEGAVGTSGSYQRYFEQDGTRYWHILDPDTAAPARSGLAGVTVVGRSGLTCDGLSTALFVMGLEEGAQFWRDHPSLDFEAIFVTEDGGIYVTAGLKERFSLVDGDQEVTVLE